MNLFRILFLTISIFLSLHSTVTQAAIKINQGWEYRWEGENDEWRKYPDVRMSLPNPHKYLWLRLKLPPLDSYRVPAIDVRIKTYFEAYLNDQSIFHYHQNWSLENVRGGVRHLFPITGGVGQEKYLYFKVGSGGSQIGLEGNVYIGEHESLMREIINHDETRLILGILLCVFSVICLLVAIVTKEAALLYICGFGFNMGIWTLSFCHELTQSVLLGGWRNFWDPAIYWSSYLAPIFILTFIASLKSIFFRKILHYLRNIFVVFAVVVITAAIFSLFPLRSANFVFNLMLIPTGAIITIATILSALKGDRESRIVLAGIVFVGCYTLVDSLSYTYKPIFSRDIESPQGQWGMAAIFIALIIIWIERYRNGQKDLQEAKKQAAISKLTQMLAHDVRKPFSILKMSLDLFRAVNSVAELRQKISQLAPEVEKSIMAVNGMINDIMEFGRTAPPQREATSPESLIEASLNEVCRMHPDVKLAINYDLKHSHMLDVDPMKVSRVFSNILGNALQASSAGHCIWIKTQERHGFVTFCLGNSGSFIAKEDLRNIFDDFFTKNKKGGTGLGLAIAQKTVLDHGGKIWCESSEIQKSVEFFFTLPVKFGMVNQTTAKLLSDTAEICKLYEKSMVVQNQFGPSSPVGSIPRSLEEFAAIVVQYGVEIKRKIKLAIVDDEAVYRNAIGELIQKAERLNELIEVLVFSSPVEIASAIMDHSIDFVICDVDLGMGVPNGYELVESLRNRGYSRPICIHSNRSLPEDYAQSVKSGAQAFLPKPINLFFLVKFMADMIESERNKIETEPAKNITENGVVDRVAYIDDDVVYREFSGTLMNDAAVTTYCSPEEFIDAVEKSPELLQSYVAVFTDQNFGRLSQMKGLELGAILKSRYKYHGFVVIVSNEPINDLKNGADLGIAKPIKPWSQIKSLLGIEELKFPEVNLFQRKPHDQLTEEEIQILSRLRHDIRGDLGSIELLFMRLESLNLAAMPKDIGLVEDYFKKLLPFFPRELSEDFWRKLRAIRGSRCESNDVKNAIEDLKATFNELKKFHYYKDNWWATIPSASLQKQANGTDACRRLAFQLKDKALESGIMDACKKNLNAEVVTISDINSNFDAIITDNVELMKLAVKIQIPIVFSSHRDDVDNLLVKIRQCLDKAKKTT